MTRYRDGVSELISATVADGIGHLTLERPKALNALTHRMILRIAEVLDVWAGDPEVGFVLLDGAGERGFCAGGDIRELHGYLGDGEFDGAQDFFRSEYRMNALIGSYPKPVVGIMDGICMGGGIGLAGHAAMRVVTERSRIAMPETRIGFTPDVGGSYLLSRAPGQLGTHLALTGATMNAADAIHAGFADLFVPSGSLTALAEALAGIGGRDPAETVRSFAEAPAASPLAAAREWVDAAYSGRTVTDIIANLRGFESADAAAVAAARAAADGLDVLSPTALVVTLAAVRRACDLPDLEAVLEQEFRTVAWLMRQPDMLEGIRAQVIDKDRSPKWNPATLAELPADLGELALADHGLAPVWPA